MMLIPRQIAVRLLRSVSLACIASPVAAQRGALVRGTVHDSAGAPVASADVAVTGLGSGAMQTRRTNAKGEFAAYFAQPEPGYRITIRAIGFARVIRTVTPTEFGGMTKIDVSLIRSAVVLPEIVTTAQIGRAAPSSSARASIGSIADDLQANSQFLLDPSNLASLVQSTPGVAAVGDSGYSVLGASSAQNSLLVDGLPFDGARLPRDALGSVRLLTTASDPATGGFAGGQLTVSTRPAPGRFKAVVRPQFVNRSITLAPPDGVPPSIDSYALSGFAGGPLRPGHESWFGALDLRRSQDATGSLANADPKEFAAFGVSLDSIEAVRTALADLGIPLTTPNTPMRRSTTDGVASLRVDHNGNGLSLSATGLLNWNQSGGGNTQPLLAPTGSIAQSSRLGRIALHGGFYSGSWLNELGLAWSGAHRQNGSYAELPAATVLVGRTAEGGGEGLPVAIGFGGRLGSTTEASVREWDVRDDLSWVSSDGRHQLRGTLDWQAQNLDRSTEPNRFGSLTYRSVTELMDNDPEAYALETGQARIAGHGTMLALSIGDVWAASPGRLLVQGGARFEMARFGDPPPFNPALAQALGVRTDVAPRVNSVSPRLGFAWTLQPKGPRTATPVRAITNAEGRTVLVTRRVGTGASDLAPPAILGGKLRVAGGIGAFEGTIGPSFVSDLSAHTGLAGATRTMRCIGDAVPNPDWLHPAPLECPAASTTFSSSLPAVIAVSPGYSPPRSWRANLELDGAAWHGWAVVPRFIYSVGVHNQSLIDRNLVTDPAFVLAHEGNRPVFAPAAAIVPATGLFAPDAARRLDAFGSVDQIVSDLGYHSWQAAVTTAPLRGLFGKLPFRATYVLTGIRTSSRGFGGTTAGNPNAVERFVGRSPQHELQLTLENMRTWKLQWALRLDLRSGIAYTPLVLGDINGDGLANDRAFVFDTATVGIGRAMASMLQSTSASARNCLLRQSGQVAAPNSCRTGWTARLDVGLGFDGDNAGPSERGLKFLVQFENVSTALARLLNWKTPLLLPSLQSVDPVLLRVTGFDSVARAFRYDVNRVFGRASPQAASHSAPFRVQVGMQYTFGGPSTSPLVEALQLRPRRGDPPLTPDSVRASLRRYVGDPVAPILAHRQDRHLTTAQVAALDSIDHQYRARIDSILEPTAEFVVRRGRDLTDGNLAPWLAAISRDAREAYREARRGIDGVLGGGSNQGP